MQKIFSKNSNLDDTSICLSVFPSRSNLKLHKSFITPKTVKRVKTNLDSSKGSETDCIPVVVLKNCELFTHTIWTLQYLSEWVLFSRLLEGLIYKDPVFRNVGERSATKNNCLVSLFSVVSKFFEKLAYNRNVDHLEKCGLFADFQ